jgi:hypothetical protein
MAMAAAKGRVLPLLAVAAALAAALLYRAPFSKVSGRFPFPRYSNPRSLLSYEKAEENPFVFAEPGR